MAAKSPDTASPAPRVLIQNAIDRAGSSLEAPGDWLTGEQRIEAWREARDAETNELDRARRAAISPSAVDGSHPEGEALPAAAVEVVHRIASDPGRLSRSWAESMIGALGEETYTELVGVTAISATLDTFSRALGRSVHAIARSAPAGQPSRVRPDDVGDVGAWVAQSTAVSLANVSRSLSLVPITAEAWVGLVQAMYSRGAEFLDLDWRRALTRTQVELVASRTTAELECFY